MWNKPWTMKEGFLIGGGLILIGLVLQLSIGPVVWKSLAWPVNGMMMAGLLMVIVLMYLLRKRVYAFRFIGTYQAAVPALAYAVVLTIIMGLIRQTGPTSSTKDGGNMWLNDMVTFWPFVLVYVYITVILGQIILRRIINGPLGRRTLATEGTQELSIISLKRDIPFLLNHLGLFIAMTTATLGNADLQRLRMITVEGVPEWRAMTEEGTVKKIPLVIVLKHFIMETYDDGSPKRFASDVQIQTPSGENIHTTIEVNKPVKVDGWKIYQYSYDTEMGAMSRISVLELVSDPWLPLVYTGIYMMLAGAVCMLFMGGKRKRADSNEVQNRKS